MRSDRPFRKALLVASVFTLVCVLFPKYGHHSLLDMQTLADGRYFLAGMVVVALGIGTWAFFSNAHWSSGRIVGAFMYTGIAVVAVAIAILIFSRWF